MTSELIPLLAAYFWLGFSLSFFITVLFRRLSDEHARSEETQADARRIGTGLRFILCLFPFAGLFGTAALYGTLSAPDSAGIALIIGVPLGIWIANRLHIATK